MRGPLKLIYPKTLSLPEVIDLGRVGLHFYNENQGEIAFDYPDGSKNMGYAMLKACGFKGKMLTSKGLIKFEDWK